MAAEPRDGGAEQSVPPGRSVLVPQEPGRLDWLALFGRAAPVEIEVGSGKGRYLLAAAAGRPTVDFLGIERRPSLLDLCAERAAKRGLPNVRLIRDDAAVVLWSRVPAASVSAVHVYYPDPWWKARHRKRRVFTPAFVADVARCLAPGGTLRVATDVGGYFVEIGEVVGESGLFEAAGAAEGEFGTADSPLTSYQAKYLRLGRKVHAGRFVRNRAPAPETPDPADRLRLARLRKRAGAAARR